MEHVVFLDSGVGGLPYLFHFLERNPGIGATYLADNAYFPYGTKTETQLKAILKENMENYILPLNPLIIVLACNTASVVGLDFLRQTYPEISFVGTVPAIKPAALNSKKRSLGVLATTRTISDPYIDSLYNRYAPGFTLVKCPVDRLVSRIELSRPGVSVKVDDIVQQAKQEFVQGQVDQVVLGCTHFLHVHEELGEYFGPGITLVDSRDGISRRIEHLMNNPQKLDQPAFPKEADPVIPRLIHTGKQKPGPLFQWLIDQKKLVSGEVSNGQ